MQNTSKTRKHLVLDRQTLRVLNPGEFALVGGGGGTTTSSGTITQAGMTGTITQADAKVSSSACDA